MDLIDKINNDIAEAEKNNNPLLSVYKDIKRAATELHVHSGAGHTKVYDSTVIRAISKYLDEGGNEIAWKYLTIEKDEINAAEIAFAEGLENMAELVVFDSILDNREIQAVETFLTKTKDEEPEFDVDPFLPIIEIPAAPVEESNESVEESFISDPIQTVDFTKLGVIEIPNFNTALEPLQEHLSNTEIVNPTEEVEEINEQPEEVKAEPKKRGRKPKNVEQN